MKDRNPGGLWATVCGEAEAIRKVLEDHGVTKEHLALLRTDSDYAKRVAEFMCDGDGLRESVSHRIARMLLGKNFFGVEEWSKFYGVSFSKEQLQPVVNFPWSRDILDAPCPFVRGKRIKDTHFAFLGLDYLNDEPLTILKFHKLHPEYGEPRLFYYTNKTMWYGTHKFSTEVTCGLRWYLILKETMPDSGDKTYEKQMTMLPPEYEIPSACEYVTHHILYYRKNGIYLNLYPGPRKLASLGRCRDIVYWNADSSHVLVGAFGHNGLMISADWHCSHYYSYGLAASRKLPS
jgi:hypothetical protein